MRAEKKLIRSFHRNIFCWTDYWHELSLADIRKLEEKTKEDLKTKSGAKYSANTSSEISIKIVRTTSGNEEPENDADVGVTIAEEPYNGHGHTESNSDEKWEHKLPERFDGLDGEFSNISSELLTQIP